MTNLLPVWYLNNKYFEPFVYIEDAFTDEECERIKKYSNQLEFDVAMIGENQQNDSVRSNKIAWINKEDDTSEWLYRKLTDSVNYINNEFWKFDLEYMSPLQYTKYDSIGNHSDYHLDIMNQGNTCRKLSFSLQLDDSDSYEGCDLVIKTSGENYKANRKKGTINFFPSFILHKVTPLERGERNCIVGWVCGPDFK